jgi:hypothetical protein
MHNGDRADRDVHQWLSIGRWLDHLLPASLPARDLLRFREWRLRAAFDLQTSRSPRTLVRSLAAEGPWPWSLAGQAGSNRARVPLPCPRPGPTAPRPIRRSVADGCGPPRRRRAVVRSLSLGQRSRSGAERTSSKAVRRRSLWSAASITPRDGDPSAARSRPSTAPSRMTRDVEWKVPGTPDAIPRAARGGRAWPRTISSDLTLDFLEGAVRGFDGVWGVPR